MSHEDTLEGLLQRARETAVVLGVPFAKGEILWGDILEGYDEKLVRWLVGDWQLDKCLQRERERRGVEWAATYEQHMNDGGGDKLIGFPVRHRKKGEKYLIVEVAQSIRGEEYFYRLADERGVHIWQKDMKAYEGRYYEQGETARLREGWDKRAGDRVKHRVRGVSGVVVGAAHVNEEGVVFVPVLWDGFYKEVYELGGDVV